MIIRMRALIAIICAVFALAAVAQVDGATLGSSARVVDNTLYRKFLCRSKPNGFKAIVPGSCSEYYLCENGISQKLSCPRYFDAESGSCVFNNPGCRESVIAAARPLASTGPCSGISNGHAVSAANPAVYYKCLNGEICATSECPAGQAFNLAKLVCDIPSNCAPTAAPPREPTTKPPCAITTPECVTTPTPCPTTASSTTTCSTTTCSTTTCSTRTCSTTNPTTVPTTKPFTMPTTKSYAVRTTKPTTVRTTKLSTVPTTSPTTKPTTVPTTKSTTAPTTVSTTCSTTTCSTTTCSKTTSSTTTCSTTTCSTTTCSTTTCSTTTCSTTKTTSVPTTKSTTVPTTKPTTVPTTRPTTVPATKSTTAPTTKSTTFSTTTCLTTTCSTTTCSTTTCSTTTCSTTTCSTTTSSTTTCSTTTCSTTTSSTTTSSTTTSSTTTSSTTTCSTTSCSTTTCSTRPPCTTPPSCGNSAASEALLEPLRPTLLTRPSQPYGMNNDANPDSPLQSYEAIMKAYTTYACRGKENGFLLASLKSCNEYYICRNEQALRVSCGDKYFNALKGICDLPDNTSCIQPLQTKRS